MGTNQDDKSNARVSPHRLQLDPGLKDWRDYKFNWGSSSQFAEVLAAAKTGSTTYNAGTEYWFVDKTALAYGTGLTITSQDKEWTDPMPTLPSAMQEFTSPTSGTWEEVRNEVATGMLYKHTTKNAYVRFATSGTSPNQAITLVRWYLGTDTQPPASFDPSGTYVEASSLGSGTYWFADSKSS
ncbi:hypothetical protein [Polyangium aurulentum]|uniref:hypothetical protein n=1 Tax=Polyangium aurulentum TaxID=2567896 RepID=UPI0010ADBD1C|nr:hypothetical protein [Polyangium aurulentum]UQA58375.1 hypothetical protein E8A73_045215 [Polyangium aurulentum]